MFGSPRRRFLVLSASHTPEDMASRWTKLDMRRRRRKPQASKLAKMSRSSAPTLPGGRVPDLDAIAVARLADEVKERETRIAELSAKLQAEKRARSEADTRAAAAVSYCGHVVAAR